MCSEKIHSFLSQEKKKKKEPSLFSIQLFKSERFKTIDIWYFLSSLLVRSNGFKWFQI